MRREVRLVMVEECGVPVRLMTMGRMSTTVPGLGSVEVVIESRKFASDVRFA